MKFLGFTAVIWTLDAASTMVAANTVGLRMAVAAAFLLIAGLGSALPSTPGYVGIYQFVAVSVLGPFGFSRTSAIAYILLAQALLWLVVGFWGMIGLSRHRAIAAVRTSEKNAAAPAGVSAVCVRVGTAPSGFEGSHL
jgi:uncharacterized membrane protein YbhN (UPF0104 family)